MNSGLWRAGKHIEGVPTINLMQLIRAREIRLTWADDRICAFIEADALKDRLVGFGDTVAQAVTDLLTAIRDKEITIWVPRPANQFIEDGVVKCACPECGHVTDTGEFDRVIAFVCDECGTGVDVAPVET